MQSLVYCPVFKPVFCSFNSARVTILYHTCVQEWEQAVNKGRNVLRNTYIATYFMDRSTQRLQLESLQKRLEGELGQLTEMLRQLPHRRSMLEGPKTEDTQPASPHESFIALVRITFSMIRELGHCLICAVMRVLNSQSTMIEEVSLHGRQVCFCLETADTCIIL